VRAPLKSWESALSSIIVMPLAFALLRIGGRSADALTGDSNNCADLTSRLCPAGTS
jgi:hypothetical protein